MIEILPFDTPLTFIAMADRMISDAITLTPSEPLPGPLLDIEPSIPVGIDRLYWLRWILGLGLLLTISLTSLFLAKRYLLGWHQRWLKAKWLRQLTLLSKTDPSEKLLKAWLLQHYNPLKNWPLQETQQQQLNLWLFSTEPLSYTALTAWIKALPVAKLSHTAGKLEKKTHA